MRASPLVLLALAVMATAALAKDPPLDPWSDDEWHIGLFGLTPRAVRAVQWNEKLYLPLPGREPVLSSSRVARLSFDDEGRLAALSTERVRRGNSTLQHSFRYVWDAKRRLQRIDEDGFAQPFLQRTYDGAGRITEELERTGAITQRTVVRFDAGGREVDRVVEQGKGVSRVHEQRSYHPTGNLKSLELDGNGGEKRMTTFDTEGRPVKIIEHGLTERSTVEIRYPEPLVAVHTRTGTSLTREGLRHPEWVRTFRVREAKELQVPGEPQVPVSSRETRDGRTHETQFDIDSSGRITAQRDFEADRPGCVAAMRYHPSGLLESMHWSSPDSNTRCPGGNDVEHEIEVDARGNWIRDVVYFLPVNAPKVRVADNSREIEYR